MVDCALISVPMREGTGRYGCDMGPSAFRAAGLVETLAELGHRTLTDLAVQPALAADAPATANPRLKHLGEVVAWISAIYAAVAAVPADEMPVILGGDHTMAAGVLPALAARAAKAGKPFFVLWLDAHSDCHTLATTTSGNLHGVPVAYAVGAPEFAGVFPPLPAKVDPANICMMGIRSVDPAERVFLAEHPITIHDMRAIDEHGVAPLLSAFLARVAEAGGHLHVSLDVDFLDPAIAPGVGTTVPGGATFREAHLVMELLHDSGLVSSLDLAELNPFLDERGRTAILMVDLAASLMGRRVLDRPTRSFG
jgi:arginase